MAGSETLAKHLKQFDLKIEDLSDESGRCRDTLYSWWKTDKKLIKALIKATLTSHYHRKLSIIK